MILPDSVVETLRRYADKKLYNNIHPEDAKVYSAGLEDGCQILAEMVLGHLKEEEPKADA